ncbi:unnamed protein product, partial [marine sediment metagenome]
TDEDVNFFGLEIELWRIGDSDMAPKFNIVSKPNDWTRTVKTTAAKTELSDTEKLLFDYWSELLDFMRQQNTTLRLPKPYPQHFVGFTVGRSYFIIYTRASKRDQRIGAYLCISGPNRLKFYDTIEKQYGEQAGQVVGSGLDWRRRPDKKESHIELYHSCDPSDRADWSNQFEWLSNAIEKLHAFFSPVVKQLEVSELDEIEDQE